MSMKSHLPWGRFLGGIYTALQSLHIYPNLEAPLYLLASCRAQLPATLERRSGVAHPVCTSLYSHLWSVFTNSTQWHFIISTYWKPSCNIKRKNTVKMQSMCLSFFRNENNYCYCFHRKYWLRRCAWPDACTNCTTPYIHNKPFTLTKKKRCSWKLQPPCTLIIKQHQCKTNKQTKTHVYL